VPVMVVQLEKNFGQFRKKWSEGEKGVGTFELVLKPPPHEKS